MIENTIRQIKETQAEKEKQKISVNSLRIKNEVVEDTNH